MTQRKVRGAAPQVPMVIRGPGGVGRQLGAEHSQRLESYFQSIPGVQLVMPPPPPPPLGHCISLHGRVRTLFVLGVTLRSSLPCPILRSLVI